MVKGKQIKPYKVKILPKKVEWNTAAGTYCTTHDVKLLFSTKKLSISKLITPWFHIENEYGDTGIWYDTIIGWYMMIKFGMLA